MTLRAALDGYLATRKNLAERSRQDNARRLRRTLPAGLTSRFEKSRRKWLRSGTPTIAAEVKERAAAAVKQGGRGDRRGGGPTTGATTANATMRAFRAIWYWAAERAPDLPPIRSDG